MTRIGVSGLTKAWGDAAALRGIDFEAVPGELLVLLGPSGCGKSTTLRLVAGLDTATSGSIRFDQRDMTNLPPAQRGISMVFQSYALFPHLSVRENVVFGLKVRRVPAAERERRLAQAAEMLGIGQLLERKPAQLSGGQRQRVALARAIVSEARVCLMDEPLSNLDAQLRHEMRSEIRSLQQRLGMTMVYVTHDQTEAMTMADQIILLRDGLIEQSGTPRALYDSPRTSFVARFLGSPAMNVLDVTSGPLRAALETRGSGIPAGAMMLGIRPEAIAVAASGVPATVVAVEYLGADSILLCEIAGARVSVRTSPTGEVLPGRHIHLALAPERLHWFGKDGARLDRPALGHVA